MNRVAINLGFFQIYWYSLFILIGILVAFLILYIQIKKENININKFFDMAIWTIVFGILGARLYYVLFNLDYYSTNPVAILEIWNGGLAIHGGLMFGTLYVIYWTKKNNVNTLKYLDIIVLSVIIAQAIGRWGNFFNQEAYGIETTYESLKNMHLPKFIINGMYIDNAYRTPTFLYESLWNLLGFGVLLIINKLKKERIGLVFGTYLVWYSIGRFFIEYLRTDSLMLGNIRVAQLISCLLLIMGIIIIYMSLKNKTLIVKK